MQSHNRGWLVLALFFCSGATALVYEVVWSKFLSQMFGSTIYAQTVVLAAFMGGLALGNKLFGRWADKASRPVRAYGVLEIAIGLYAFLFPLLDRAADIIFISVGTGIVEHPGLLLVLKGVLAVGLLLGPTILMGGTLPLMAAWLQKSNADAGQASARFYSVNSLGAVCGSALAGFWLVQSFGMIATLYITATTNVVLGLAAMLLGNTPVSVETPKPETASSINYQPSTINSSSLRWPAIIVFITGAVSMGLEILASRSLALIFGSSLQSFAVVLISFILGIGLGSAWIASPRRKIRANETVVVFLLCAAAAWVSILVMNIESWVDFYRIARTGLARTPTGYVYHQLLTVGISMIVLGVPAACIGAVLPLMIRAVSADGKLLGKKVGALLTANTLGCVVGVLFTGFVLMPWLGLRNAFAALALVLAVIAIVIAWRKQMKLGMGGAVVACGLGFTLFMQSDQGWKYVMSSGIFRIWETTFEPRFMSFRKEHFKLLFYEDGPDATVSVEQTDSAIASPSIGLRINGKPDAGTSVDLCNQLLLAHLPLLVKPDAKDVFVLGFGSGMTAGAALAHPLEHLDVGENCGGVISAGKYFADWNYHVLDDPRTRVWREDARTVLKLRPQLYDVIITEPSNPWTVGVGGVFSREFYKLAATRLKSGGIIAQWFHLYETDDEIVDLVLRTFGSVFPYMEIWDTGSGDMVILGSLEPWRTGPDVFRRGFANERVRRDLQMIDIHSPETLLVRQLASQQTAFAIAGAGPIQTDLFPILEYSAPKAFFLGGGSRMLCGYDERTSRQLLAPFEKREVLRSIPTESSKLAFSSFLTINAEFYACLFGQPASANVPCAMPTPNPAPPVPTDGTIINLCSAAISVGDWQRADQLASYALQQQPNNLDAAYLKRIIDRQLGGKAESRK